MKEIKFSQYKVPHCKHCEWYKEQTDTCLQALMTQGLNRRAKACNSRKCASFKPKEEYKMNYKELQNER